MNGGDDEKHEFVHTTMDGPTSKPLRSGEEVRVGDRRLRWGHEVKEMTDSSHLLGDPDALRSDLAAKGYALLRGVIPTQRVRAARQVVLRALQAEWNAIDTSKGPVEQGCIRANAKGLLLTGFRSVTHDPDLLSVVEGPELKAFFHSLYGSQPATMDNKWVRVMGHGEATDEHTDFFRFARAADEMYTCWIPLGDYSIHQGTLAVCEESHKLSGFDESEFEESKVELPAGYKEHSKDLIWQTADFQAGDMVVFDIRTVHASTANLTERFRLSVDTRWQPARCVKGEHKSTFRAL